MEIRYFLVDRSRKKTSVRAIIHLDSQRYHINVKESVLVKYWNTSTYRCRVVREYPEASAINHRLKQWEEIITAVFNNFGLILPTQQMVLDAVDAEIRKRNIEAGGIIENEQEQHLVNFAIMYRDESILSDRTKTGYTTTINKLIEFETKYKTKLRFIDIDIDFYKKFKKWMLESTYEKGDKELHYSKNYIGALFKNIIKFMRASRKKGLHSFVGFEDEDFKSEKEETDAIYLTQEEIIRIFNLEFTPEFLIENGFGDRSQNLKLAIESLYEERDRFLIGCLTALRHSDYSRLDTLNFKQDMIDIWTKKRDKKVYIPMHYLLKQVLERRNNILPGSISDQKHNDQIKVIGRLAKIDDEVMLTKTRGGKRESITGPKYEFITSHTARRSGATNMYLAGIDIKFIQDILGHSKVEQTLKYIKVSAEDNAKRLQNHEYFTGKKEIGKDKK